MGDKTYNSQSKFFISKENLPRVLEAIRMLSEQRHSEVYGQFQCVGLEVAEDAEGNVTALFLATEYLGNAQVAVFNAIAPFVANESHIMFIGDDARQWAWVFRENPQTGTVEAVEEDVIPVLASEHRKLRGDDHAA